MAYFECIIGGGTTIEGNTITVTCDHRFAGLTITCSNGVDVHTQTCPSLSPYTVQFTNLAAGTWTISGTISGKTYSTTVTISDEYTSMLDAGFSWEEWLTLGGLDPTDYNSLAEVLADEKALRRLMTVHASVDYMCENEDDTETLEIILGNDLAAKWINLRDYALDSLYAVPAIATIMDSAGKYGYGEWALMPQVPKMASNTTPYYSLTGTEDSSGQHYLWHAFDRNDSTFWNNGSTANDGYLIVDFGKSIEIKQVSIKPRFVSGHSFVKNFTISASDDGTTWGEPLLSGTHTDSANTENFTIPNSSKHRYWRIRKDGNNYTDTTIQILELQFYAWQPKGCVPVMTANDAPYGWASGSSVVSGSSYHRAFDGDDNTYWYANATENPKYIQFRAVNPVCVKRVKFCFNQATTMPKSGTLKGSNDGSTFTSIGTFDFTGEGTVNIYRDFDNSNYYAYYRLEFGADRMSGSSRDLQVNTIQLYGRTLNVSVPNMTSDTAPYGLAFATSETTTATAKAFAAFDGNTSTGAGKLSTTTSSERIGYRFLKPVDIRSVKLVIGGSSTTAFSRVIKFQYSDDNSTWTDIGGERTVNIPQGANTNTFSFDLGDENGAHQYWAMYVVKSIQSGAVSSWGTYCSELQFYGVDYSEREFATGANMKYLYDHGLELETLSSYETGGTSITNRRVDDLYVYVPSATNNNASILSSQDLTGFSLMRAVATSANANGGFLGVYSSLYPSGSTAAEAGTEIKTPLVDRFNVALGVSSYNESKAVGIRVSNGSGSAEKYLSVSEIWLE